MARDANLWHFNCNLYTIVAIKPQQSVSQSYRGAKDRIESHADAFKFWAKRGGGGPNPTEVL